MISTLAHCNVCGGKRNHEVLHSIGTKWENAEFLLSGGDTYQTLKCCGCEDIKFRQVSFTDDDEESSWVRFFPSPVLRRFPDWFPDLKLNLKADDLFVEGLLREIYVALQNNLPSLAAMGIRALLENIMISRVGDNNSFKKNVEEFKNLGHLSTLERGRLNTILDAGHATMHRAFFPQVNDVITCLEITEHIVESVFLHEAKVKYLRTKIPER